MNTPCPEIKFHLSQSLSTHIWTNQQSVFVQFLYLIRRDKLLPLCAETCGESIKESTAKVRTQNTWNPGERGAAAKESSPETDQGASPPFPVLTSIWGKQEK